jgi:MoxR-like ATPase
MAHPLHNLDSVATLAEIVELRRAVSRVRISEPVRRYIVDIVGATRRRGPIRLGASPRASIALQRLSQALALIDGEDFVTPDHVREIVVPALAHRITLDSHSQFSGVLPSDVVSETLREVALPA